jgi:hypothetical protein
LTAIYHITHLRNLPGIIAGKCLHCDARVAASKLGVVGIAHQHIKDRRARKSVPVKPGGFVADYVPFYFAPRSPMLFAIDRGQVAGFDGGQSSVLYLVSSVRQVIAKGLPFCFTDGHAEMGPTLYYNDWRNDRDKVPWDVMDLRYWNDTAAEPDRKRRRQAEFLVQQAFPWDGFEKIGVYDSAAAGEVQRILAGRTTPPVEVHRDWYF